METQKNIKPGHIRIILLAIVIRDHFVEGVKLGYCAADMSKAEMPIRKAMSAYSNEPLVFADRSEAERKLTHIRSLAQHYAATEENLPELPESVRPRAEIVPFAVSFGFTPFSGFTYPLTADDEKIMNEPEAADGMADQS